jgi:NTP pyrophosphatase (non-canonical NTP hydrolase)
MNAYEYLANVLKTESKPTKEMIERLVDNDARPMRLLHSALGICTEAGEFTDVIKKHIYYGQGLDRVNLIEELGDIMWYIAVAADTLDVSLEEVMLRNNKKLASRYKHGFSENDAVNRDLGKERSTLSHQLTLDDMLKK